MSDSFIEVTGAEEHNLKSVSVRIPKNKLVIFTGLSGSGKSSLAFDTLYAEGQRRYVESLSSYARQFLGVMQKPQVERITGLSPAISIDQKTTSHNPRSTVGTITEIYDYLRLLYARIGRPHCPSCGKEITTQTIDQIINQILDRAEQHAREAGTCRFLILSPVVRQKKGEFQGLFESLQEKGYQRVRIDREFYNLREDFSLLKTNKHTIDVILDRVSLVKSDLKQTDRMKTLRSRLNQTVEEALQLANGLVRISIIEDDALEFPEAPQSYTDTLFSEKRACSDCGISLPELEPRFFSFNSPQGACPTCNGLGTLLKIDTESIIAPEITISQGAVIPFARMMSSDTWWARLVKQVVTSEGYDFHTTKFKDIDSDTQQLLFYGSDTVYTVSGINRFGRATTIQEQFEGFVTNLERRYEETDSEYIRKEIGRFMQRKQCPACHGARLKPEALSVHINGQSIAQVSALGIGVATNWFDSLQKSEILTQKEQHIGTAILKEITSRLEFLSAVGLNYLTIDREASTLAGGEAQRIRLASQIGTGLTGVLYILDEPTIGLHQRDNHRLIETLLDLRDKGNSVIVVEHDRDIMLAADSIFDFGPAAGKRGGEIIAQGTPTEIMRNADSITGRYLSRKKEVSRSKELTRTVVDDDAVGKQSGALSVIGATQHNLKQLDVSIPLGKLSCITGISGSGKSTLLHDTIYRHVAKHLDKRFDGEPGIVEQVMVPDSIRQVRLIDQSPIGRTPRSNPATYTKMFDYIRKLFASTKDASLRGYKAGRFSFNVKGGRCEACQGDGQNKIEMQFLPDVYVTCEVCEGQRYNQETLEVLYRGKNISQVLHMTVEEAAEFFAQNDTITKKLETLKSVGLGYLELGQPAPTLSGGEAQRVKLAKELASRSSEHVLYLLDEPTTGLHFADIQKLLDVLIELVEQDNTVVVIEHNLDIIKNADWIIDLGPEGGDGGGALVAEGTPSAVAQHATSYTGRYLAEEFAHL